MTTLYVVVIPFFNIILPAGKTERGDQNEVGNEIAGLDVFNCIHLDTIRGNSNSEIKLSIEMIKSKGFVD